MTRRNIEALLTLFGLLLVFFALGGCQPQQPEFEVDLSREHIIVYDNVLSDATVITLELKNDYTPVTAAIEFVSPNQKYIRFFDSEGNVITELITQEFLHKNDVKNIDFFVLGTKEKGQGDVDYNPNIIVSYGNTTETFALTITVK